MPPTSTAGPASRLRNTALVTLVAVSIAAVLGAWAWSRWGPGAPQQPSALPGDRAEVVARVLGVVFEASQASWQRSLSDLGADFAPAELQFFTRSRTSPCTGTELATGPFYCRLSREAAFDLGFLDELGLRLRRDAELGWALVAARLAAAHAQGELGLSDRADAARRGSGRRERAAIDRTMALQADCLTGVWAAGADLVVPPHFYYDLVRIIRNIAEDRAKTGPEMPAGIDPFQPGRLTDREAAFRTGAATGDASTCPAAYPAGEG